MRDLPFLNPRRIHHWTAFLRSKLSCWPSYLQNDQKANHATRVGGVIASVQQEPACSTTRHQSINLLREIVLQRLRKSVFTLSILDKRKQEKPEHNTNMPLTTVFKIAQKLAERY